MCVRVCTTSHKGTTHVRIKACRGVIRSLNMSKLCVIMHKCLWVENLYVYICLSADRETYVHKYLYMCVEMGDISLINSATDGTCLQSHFLIVFTPISLLLSSAFVHCQNQ